MDKQKFFSTEFGQQALAGILVLISFPVIYCGIKLSADLLAYTGMVFILVGMGIAPAVLVAQLFSRKK